jgi:cell division protein FtsN
MNAKSALWMLILAVAMAGCSGQQSDWEKTRASNTTDAYEAFLKKYPNGEFSAQAQARVKGLYEERDWQKARDTDTAEAYQAFLKQYPEGKFTDEARIRVENFSLASAPTTPSAPTDAAASAAPAPTAAMTAAPAKAAPPPAMAMKASPPPAMAMKASPPPQKSSGDYAIQLGAFKSSADAANKRWAELVKQYPKALSGLTPKVSPKSSGSGTLYRLQVASMSEQQARDLCRSLSGQGQACVVVVPGTG